MTSEISLWNRTSPYTRLYAYFNDKLVPALGKANTNHGELLRCAMNIYYDCYNNGGCNLFMKIYALKIIIKWRGFILSKLNPPGMFNRTLDFLMNHAENQNKENGLMYLPSDWPKEALESIMVAIIQVVADFDKDMKGS